jgi:hypothetical protein
VRDQLIAPAERQEKAQTWDQVVQYIRHKESRVREEIQHIAGDEFRLVATVPVLPYTALTCCSFFHIARFDLIKAYRTGSSKGFSNTGCRKNSYGEILS